MSGHFEGLYFKHQLGGRALAVIPGKSAEGAFIQVITEKRSCQVNYPLEKYRKGKTLYIGDSSFSDKGIRLAVEDRAISLHGTLRYRGLTPLRGDIMGPFRFFPMECRHRVVSMAHGLSGSVLLNGERLDFDGGTGYIEGDSGRSFPSDHIWVQCNDFARDCSIMAAVARIPFCGLRFWGCICVVLLDGHEYRLATYKSVKIRRCTPGALTLEQGEYRLEVTVSGHGGYALAAPKSGIMGRTIKENVSCPAHFRFTRGGEVLFEEDSDNASYEYAIERDTGSGFQ